MGGQINKWWGVKKKRGQKKRSGGLKKMGGAKKKGWGVKKNGGPFRRKMSKASVKNCVKFGEETTSS